MGFSTPRTIWRQTRLRRIVNLAARAARRLVGVVAMSGNDDELPKSKAKKPAGSHKVGYKHPPLHSQFKKAHQGIFQDDRKAA
jgi:hypothetical protein